MLIIQNTIDQWKIIFIIGALFYIVTAPLFMTFGSVEVQSWNEPPEKLCGNSAATKRQENASFNTM